MFVVGAYTVFVGDCTQMLFGAMRAMRIALFRFEEVLRAQNAYDYGTWNVGWLLCIRGGANNFVQFTQTRRVIEEYKNEMSNNNKI